MDIYSSVSSLKGVGPKASEKLNKAGIFNILDLLLYFPRDYEFLSGNPEFNEIDCEEKQILTCTVKKIGSAIRTRNGKYLVTIEFEYKGHKVEGKWFNQPYIRNNFRLGCDYSLLGKFKRIGNMLEIVNPIIGGNVVLNSEIKPIYPLKGDLTDKFLTKQIISVLENIKISENLPKEILERYKLISLDSAIREIHFPKDKELLNSAITRLKFQELFTYSMKLLLLKHNIKGK
nr:DNA helicase RecG [Clostridium sp.]